MRPHISRLHDGMWLCMCQQGNRVYVGYGETPTHAYVDWVSAVRNPFSFGWPY